MSIEKRLERIEAILDARGLDWDHPMVASDHFAGANKMVAEEPPKKWRILEPEEVVQEGDWVNAIVNKPDEDPPGGGWIPARASVIGGEASRAVGLYVARPVADEPAKEPEHPAGPMPDPGEGYRLLRKDPPEELHVGDEHELSKGEWVESVNARTHRKQGSRIWYRRKIEVAKQPEPAWEPKVGDWVRVTRPGDWTEWEHPNWEGAMDQFDEKIGKIECEWGDCFQICGFAAPNGFRYQFHRNWLSPAEPPQQEEPPKPPEPEYRDPVLPADLGKWAEFSHDGINWLRYKLRGCYKESESSLTIWSEKNIGFRHCRIKKDA